MEKYITDPHAGWQYELVGDYYLPIGTRFENADQDAPENSRHIENPAAASTATAQGAPTTPAADPGAQAHDRPRIGRFGRSHMEYLKLTKRHVYSLMAAEGKLGTYLAQIDEQANNMLDLLMHLMAEREGVNEQLKASDQMEWVRQMNSIRNRVEEVVNSELIYK